MPKPPPATRQFARCEGVAASRRGYHTSGTEIVRPSRRSTTRVSSVKRTLLTRSPGLTSEVRIPRLQQLGLALSHQSVNTAQLDRAEPKVTCQCDRGQPELRRLIIAVHVD